ncbi:hypothetical protein [Pseudooctadecabacter jejudonensis]|uniref:Phytanoyl-CoA dioxygenase (PhyH) n=1 Tax=Pseudooctadecabacter jejudonensis TaxID=1391910 RepID=A0A1Y5RHA6_9RHOB|nr:hypothetical protein [Pseudooctadecabacter jejudonensis]SLN17354.1 hypothetical protein PSJ8397_00553 [Pseudooctadecabacter jejudonensis]
MIGPAGFRVYPHEDGVLHWAETAHRIGRDVAQDADLRAKWLRHDGTWFVGVDALPTGEDGSIDGVPLAGPWLDDVPVPAVWHPAQLSVTYAGYPRQGPGDSDAAHRWRLNRASAHVDGLHLEGGRRFAREPHAFIVGFALNETRACPLMVWPGSHVIIGAALRAVIGDRDPRQVDVTETYQAARQQVLDQITPVPVVAAVGQTIVVHRHSVHGIAPHDPAVPVPTEGRMMAYFRPECADPHHWLLP